MVKYFVSCEGLYTEVIKRDLFLSIVTISVCRTSHVTENNKGKREMGGVHGVSLQT